MINTVNAIENLKNKLSGLQLEIRDIRKKVTYTNLSSAIYEFLNSTSILI